MPTTTWNILNIPAWIFRLKADYDLRAEFGAAARTWVLLTWAVLSCLLTELAMAGGAYVAGSRVFSPLMGIASGMAPRGSIPSHIDFFSKEEGVSP